MFILYLINLYTLQKRKRIFTLMESTKKSWNTFQRLKEWLL